MTHSIFADAISIIDKNGNGMIQRTRNEWVEVEYHNKPELEKDSMELLCRGYNLQINRQRLALMISMPV